jgi:nucleoid-associated protein YgaU
MRLLPAADAPATGPASAPVSSPAAPAVAARPDPSVPVGAVTTWTVRPGECFWSIADDVLTAAWGRPPTDAEIVPYWHTLIDANRAVLADRSNPDLIFPGQVFTVPAVPAVPPS